ncbi:HAD hydrolase family protein [Candidatus Roizmanbacteria bacterium]|nr:MAG: HAD hydrolase family protein [Candidatus Roizmanbacteria bacterium]
MERLNNGYTEMGEKLKQAKGIIFSDVDGVWLDETKNFAFPDNNSLEAILRAQSQDYVFVLNSDTGGESLLQLSREMGITSDLCIAENGSYIQTENDVWMIQEPDPRTFMSGLRIRFAEILSSSGTVWQGDATRAVRKRELKNDSPLFLVNTSRQCSVGIYARQAGMTIDRDLTESVYQTVTKVCSDVQGVEISQYPEIGSCLVRTTNRPSKADAVSRLLELSGFGGPCFMIGDSMADAMRSLDKRVITCAVGNASPELKTNADVINETAVLDRSTAEIINSIISS